MSKVRFLLVGAGAALALGTGGVLASVGAATPTNSDSHGDAVAAAAQDTCPHGPNGVHGKCVSAIASSKSESKESDSTCNAADTTEDASETTAEQAEDASEKSAKTSKAADKTEDASERSKEHAEDKTEKTQVKACEAAEASSS
jgi:hypothetical protein